MLLLASTSFSFTLEYSLLILGADYITFVHTACTKIFLDTSFYMTFTCVDIQFENVHCSYINLIDSKYSISHLKAFVHHVVTSHKTKKLVQFQLRWKGELNAVLSWSSLVQRDEGFYRPNRQTNLVTAFHVSFILQLNKHNSFLPLEPSSPSTKELHGPDHRSHDKINWRGVSLSPFCLKFWHRLHWLTDDDGTKKYAHPMRKKLKNCFSFFTFSAPFCSFASLTYLLTSTWQF